MGAVTRFWRPDDTAALGPQILDAITTNAANGSFLAPTGGNVEYLLKLGLHFAAEGDPSFVRWSDAGVLVGWTLWGFPPAGMGLEFSSRTCLGFCTYVVPGLRRLGIATALRARALSQARDRGYVRVVGTAYSPIGAASATANGFRPIGTEMEYRL